MLETNRIYAAMGNQPIFKYGVRGVRWGATVQQLRKYNFRAAMIVHALLVGLWMLLVVGYLTLDSVYTYYSPQMYTLLDSGSYIGFVMLISIALAAILDFGSVVFALNSIGGEINAGRWDLLRMTPLPEDRIVAAKHSIAQVRAWRVMAVVLFMRVAVVVLLALHVFILPLLTGTSFPLADAFRYDFINPFLAIITFLIFLAVYIVEPVWRMRAMTAIGMAISARVRNIAFAFLVAFAAIIGTWIVQALILGVIGWFTLNLSMAFLFGSVALCGVLAGCIVTAWVVRAFYIGLEGWGLGYATRRIYRESSQ